MGDDLSREAVVLVSMSQWCAHEASIAHRARATQVIQQVDNAAATPTFADQELHPQSSTRVVYWEGTVVAAGSAGGRAVRGVGSVELVGYEAKPDL
jgi:Lipocalin-like domain